MKLGSLFAGIGGFDLAGENVGIETVFQVENDKWCLKVLEKNFPDAKRFEDIRDFKGRPFRGKIDILTGGFPCQPFSVAGKRKGKKDLRFLWPEMLRVIREIRPRFIIGENVSGIINLALDQVLSQLENEGYATETFVIPACAKDAPHRRDRVWIIAYAVGKTVRQGLGELGGQGRTFAEEVESNLLQQEDRAQDTTDGIAVRSVLPNTNRFRTQVSSKRKISAKQIPFRNGAKGSYKAEASKWPTEPRVGRVADGIPRRLDRLKGLGNAIVPQVAEEIFRILLRLVKTQSKTLNGMETGEDNDGLEGLSLEKLQQEHREFVEFVVNDLEKKNVRSRLYYENIATDFEITDKNLINELTELAVTICARELAHQEKTYRNRYDELLSLYNSQVNLFHSTGQSKLLGQHSTPPPISFLAGIITGADMYGSIFEPCAGNGLLTIASSPEKTIVNEVDKLRVQHLRVQGYFRVTSQDATKPFIGLDKKFACVLANPPLGKMDNVVRYGDYEIKSLEHIMVLNALECMHDLGNAAIILGGHTSYDDKGRISKGANRTFLDYLYKHYRVIDIIPIDKQLYSSHGNGFDARLILISKRERKFDSTALTFSEKRDTPIRDFDELYKRVMRHRNFMVPAHYLSQTEWIRWRTTLHAQDSVPPTKDEFTEQHKDFVKMAIDEGIELPYDVRISYPDLFRNTKSDQSEKDLEDDASNIINLLTDDDNKPKPEQNFTWEEKPAGDHKPAAPKKHFSEAIAVHDFLHRKERAQNYKIIFKLNIPPYSQFVAFKAFHSDYLAQRWAESELRHSFKDNFGNNVSIESIQSLDQPENLNGLGAPYVPTSQGCVVLDTVVPDAMSFETHEALQKVKEAIGGDIDEFVRNRLGYGSKTELCAALAAEQIDAVAIAIYNIEAREQGAIEGDQTGIGKGRVAAAIIRYGVKRGYQPIFLTEKPNLFSDLYRDLKAIGSGSLRPFIVNAKDDKTDILDEYGETMYEALSQKEQAEVFEGREIPARFNFLLATYSQFSAHDLSAKQRFLNAVANKNILIMDEAHNASGEGNTGAFFQRLISHCKGVLYLSATFAKKPANLPLYARKTLMSESNMNRQQLVWAIRAGGVPLQEVISSELVKEGQMVRRERSYEGVEVNYITLDEMEDEHRAIADTVTQVLRDTIRFQEDFVSKEVQRLDDEFADANVNVELRKGTKQAGVSNDPYFSRVFNVINQMLFSIKADAVAERAIMRLKEGKKPLIAFSSTMAAFIESMTNEDGEPVKAGDVIAADFSEVLKRGLSSIMRYTLTLPNGRVEQRTFTAKELGPQAELAYWNIIEKIETVSTGISISPIDVIVKKIREAGYSVAEVTGRRFSVELNEVKTESGIEFSKADEDEFPGINLEEAFGKRTKLMGRIHPRKKVLTNEAFRKFNNNEIDVLLINQAGSTGASAHAIVTDKVPFEEVKQRVMVVLQPELDISTEVQKRGRINRTGQVYKPIYDYVSSAIPAEKRLMMMLQRKLKSLDANTTSNQKQSTRILDVPDFLNKYGDLVVTEYMIDHPEINDALQDPLGLKEKEKEGKEPKELKSGKDDAAFMVSGRVAVLSSKEQQDFYDEVVRRYNDHVEYMKQTGEYDLEVEEMKLDAETKLRKVLIMGRGGRSSFGKDSVLETVEVNVLRKPMKAEELTVMIRQSLDGLTATEQSRMLLDEFKTASQKMLDDELFQAKEQYTRAIDELKTSARLKKMLEKHGWEVYERALDKAEAVIKDERKSKEEKAQYNYERRHDFAKSTLAFFHVGRLLYYPARTLDEGQIKILAVFVGFGIDRNQKNPFTPSAIKLRFAIASGLRYLVIPASKAETIQRIKGESFDIPQESFEKVAYIWSETTQQRQLDRTNRYIITGNILQALGRYRGKLINYTTKHGSVVKGILMPEYWTPDEDAEKGVAVPATKAFSILQSLVEGGHVIIGKHLSLFRRDGRFMVVVSGTKSKGGEIFLNENLLKLIDDNNFSKQSDKMIAYFDSSKLKEVLEILEKDLGTSVAVTPLQYEKIYKEFTDKQEQESFPDLEMLPEVIEDEKLRERELELEAEAIMLMLELDED